MLPQSVAAKKVVYSGGASGVRGDRCTEISPSPAKLPASLPEPAPLFCATETVELRSHFKAGRGRGSEEEARGVDQGLASLNLRE